MKKSFKIILIIVGLLVFGLGIDLTSIYTSNKPIFAIKDTSDLNSNIYRGLIYDTYNCVQYSSPQIKLKGSIFSCNSSSNIIEIIDLVSENYLPCAEALEEFYEDSTYEYYFPCIKSGNIKVKYGNGFEENIIEALKNNRVTIKDLDEYGIGYIKKIKNLEIIIDYANDESIKNFQITDDKTNNEYQIYYYNLKSVIVKFDSYQNDLVEIISTGKLTLDELFNTLYLRDVAYDGGTAIYDDGNNISPPTFKIIKCHTTEGNRDIYIGDTSLEYKGNICQ